MTYENYQTSQYQGEPMTLFRFSGVSSTTWLYTSEPFDVMRGSETYLPEAISHSPVEQNVGEGPQSIDIKVPTSSAIAGQFLGFLPIRPISVIVYSRHRPDAQYVPIFIGECSSGAHGDDGFTTIRCEPLSYKLGRNIPWPCYSSTCNWAVFGEGCGLSKDAYVVPVPVDAHDGFEISSTVIGSFESGYFNAGTAERANGETRWIVAHVDDVVTLVSPFTDLQEGEVVTFLPGCDGVEDTCVDKYNNLPNFMGFPDVPVKNPYRDNIFGTGTPGGGANSPVPTTPYNPRPTNVVFI